MIVPLIDPSLGTLAFVGMLTGVASMATYGWLSPQAQLAEASTRVKQSRAELRLTDGSDLHAVWALSKRSLRLSLRQLQLMIGPTLLAVVPILLAAWAIDNHVAISGDAWSTDPALLSSTELAFWIPLALSALAFKLYFRIK